MVSALTLMISRQDGHNAHKTPFLVCSSETSGDGAPEMELSDLSSHGKQLLKQK